MTLPQRDLTLSWASHLPRRCAEGGLSWEVPARLNLGVIWGFTQARKDEDSL